MVEIVLYQRKIFEVTSLKSIEIFNFDIFMQYGAGEYVSYMQIIKNWT